MSIFKQAPFPAAPFPGVIDRMASSPPLELSVQVERWPIAGSFAISRGVKTEAAVVVAELSDGRHRGSGECVPYGRYGETVEGVAAQVAAMAAPIARGLDRAGLQAAMGPGAARNALDCAFWDLAAKQSGRPVHELAGLPPLRPLLTAYTISLAAPREMAAAAEKVAGRLLLKVKLGGLDDPARIAAVRRAAPRCELIVDANEGWTPDNLLANLAACADAGVTLLEQPLPADRDDALARIARPLPVCADESVHARASHGGDLARHGAGHAGGTARPRRRSRRAFAVGARPAARAPLRGQPGSSRDGGTLGVTLRSRPENQAVKI